MDRYTIISTVGSEKITSNIEGGEFSYKKVLTNVTTKHFKLDIRFFDESKHVAVLVETKKRQKDFDKEQLFTYVALEQRWNKDTKIIAILADTSASNKIRVWKIFRDNCEELTEENV
ncbi:MAG: hypothetical protein HUK18_05530 [Bacteroidales bacterium]|nr:hypothetical protein [Bacteroidales bacterium]